MDPRWCLLWVELVFISAILSPYLTWRLTSGTAYRVINNADMRPVYVNVHMHVIALTHRHLDMPASRKSDIDWKALDARAGDPRFGLTKAQFALGIGVSQDSFRDTAGE